VTLAEMKALAVFADSPLVRRAALRGALSAPVRRSSARG
jgi:hypothetical protein